MARDIELTGSVPKAAATETKSAGPITIAKAKESFFLNLTVRALKPGTRYKHEILWRQCTEFAKARNLVYLDDLNPTVIDEFVGTWKDANLSRAKKMERFKQFFKFAVSRRLIAESPMAGMKGPKVKLNQTAALTSNEMTKILVEAKKRIAEAGKLGRANALRCYALILFLRFSGLRISDAVGCEIEWVKGGRVQLITRKSKMSVNVELPAMVIRELKAIKPMSDRYFFWTGNGLLETATKHWQGDLADIFEAAGIEKGFRDTNAVAHRFRDTLAVSMLERGKSLQDVADALGNTLAVTQKHYNPYSLDRQERLDDAVRDAWKNEPILDEKNLTAADGARIN